jgi:hypothetical protein
VDTLSMGVPCTSVHDPLAPEKNGCDHPEGNQGK